MTCPRILITPGEPAGIGPDVLLALITKSWSAELVAVCDPGLLQDRAKQLKLPPLVLTECDFAKTPMSHQPGTLKIVPVTLKKPCTAGELNSENAEYVLTCLRKASDACLKKTADALVTGPVHKSVINDAGIAFTGHTEFLQNYCKVKKVVMLFVIVETKVAIMTTHIPLAKVSKAVTRENFKETLVLLNDELQNIFKIKTPIIYVSGLNPHAGEQGHLGREEIDVMQPVINELNKKGLNIKGPFAADTLFTPKYTAKADVILAMYHDQALPAVKCMSFGHAVNMTLGLPFVRTSVDHGTALELAGTGKADAESLMKAVELATHLLN